MCELCHAEIAPTPINAPGLVIRGYVCARCGCLMCVDCRFSGHDCSAVFAAQQNKEESCRS